MAFLRVKCENCGGKWDVYHRDDWKDDRARTCPHCYAEVDAVLWASHVIPAFTFADEGNREIRKQSREENKPGFSFDVVDDMQFRRPYRPRHRERNDLVSFSEE